MVTQEFSNEFDTLINSYSNTPNFGETHKLDVTLDEYEKSVFLTEAQEDIVIEFYTGRSQSGESFERTEEIRRYLSDLVETATLTDKVSGYIGLSDTSAFFKLPEKVWFITYEAVKLSDDSLGCMNNNTALVTPVTQDEYYRISRNPFRGPTENRVLRLDVKDKIVEIVSDYNVSSYTVRYVSRPAPIILVDLPEGLSINNVNTRTECELNPAIHRAILERAVRLALISRTQMSGSK